MTGKKTEKTAEPDTVQINKYGNRRLYSTTHTRFLTLDEIAGLVRSGRKVRVADADSGSDITADILTQILLENGRARHFPVELLEEMIRLNGTALKDFWASYWSQSLQLFLGMQKEMTRLYLGTPLQFLWPAARDKARRRNAQKPGKPGSE